MTRIAVLIDLCSVDCLAWDWINEKLYWTDISTRNLEVYDPATGHRKVLIYASAPSGIVLDPNAG